MSKKRILIFTEYYLPGYRAGGPIRSVSNLVEWLGEEHRFFIVTSAYDYGEETAYSNISVDTWNKVGNADVFYVKKGMNFHKLLKTIIDYVNPELILFNSFFSPGYTILPLLFLKLTGRSKKVPILIAPRGEFAADTLRIKSFKKKAYIRIVRWLGLYSDVHWAFTNQKEENEFYNNIGLHYRSVSFMPNLPKKIDETSLVEVSKESGELKMVYLGRLARIKNLMFALEILEKMDNIKVQYDLYGVMDDPEYWENCRDEIDKLPANISVRYMGHIENDKVPQILSNYHLFFLPTKSENFGHSIYESLLSGTPVLISDQTPWKELSEKGLGYNFSLNKKEKFTNVIKKYACMNRQEINQVKQNVFEMIRKEDVIEEVDQVRQCLLKHI